MPRIPESAVTVGLTSVSQQPIREAALIGQAATGVAENLTDISAKLAEAERADELIQKSSSMEVALSDLQLSIEQDPSYNTVASSSQAYEAGSDQIFAEYGQSESSAVSSALKKQFLTSRLQGGVAVKRSGYKRQSDTSIAGLDTAARSLERAYASAPDDQKREQIRAQHALGVNLNAFISEQDKGDRIRDFQIDTDIAHVRGLIDTGYLNEAEVLLNSDELAGIDPNERLTLMRSVDRARSKIDTDAKKHRGVIEDKTAKDAFLVITQYRAGDGPEYTQDDFERDFANFGFQDARTIHTAMTHQDTEIIIDGEVVRNLNREIDDNNSDVIDHIHSAYRALHIDQPTFDRLLTKNQSLNDGSPEGVAYRDMEKTLEKGLGPAPFERGAGVIQNAILRVKRATDELDHYRETHPKATPDQIDKVGLELLDRYGLSRSDPRTSRPVPYSLQTRSVTTEQLDAAEVKLADDYQAGVIDEWKYLGESDNIRAFRSDVERRAEIEAAKKGTK